MTDEEILKFLWPNKISIYSRYLKSNKIPNNMLEYLSCRFHGTKNPKEALFLIKNNYDDVPRCPECGNYLKFKDIKSGFYHTYCSKSCCNKSEIKKQNTLNNLIKKYGVTNSYNIPYVIEKMKNNNMEKYGVEWNTERPDVKDKINKKWKSHTNEEKKEIKEKTNNTYIKKYGKTFSEFFGEKFKEISLEKYNVSNIAKADEVRKKISNKLSTLEVQEKINNTKRKNNSFNKSTPEDESYELLKEKFNEVIRQYHSVEYPYNCDFYIPSIDTYIECNYHWTHGFRPYIGTEEDLNKIKYWKDKHTKFYDNAIKTWTYYDINKRNIAKENKLNWFEFFYIKDLKDWIIKYEK